MKTKNVRFERVGRTRVRTPRQYECRVPGIHAHGSAKAWALDLVAFTTILVGWGIILWFMLLVA